MDAGIKLSVRSLRLRQRHKKRRVAPAKALTPSPQSDTIGHPDRQRCGAVHTPPSP